MWKICVILKKIQFVSGTENLEIWQLVCRLLWPGWHLHNVGEDPTSPLKCCISKEAT